ncbi:MAG TPA: hypothetical protein VHS58_11365 [Acetobacteraceae bacterium]|nr:hypothetical protein [Acetobacteraceae bacterium]
MRRRLRFRGSAGLLISARSVAASGEPAALGSAAVPEVDRAMAIVGLLETGTTDCARRAFWIRAVGAADAVAPAICCLSASVPGSLEDVIAALDKGDAHRLDRLLGENAGAMRA